MYRKEVQLVRNFGDKESKIGFPHWFGLWPEPALLCAAFCHRAWRYMYRRESTFRQDVRASLILSEEVHLRPVSPVVQLPPTWTSLPTGASTCSHSYIKDQAAAHELTRDAVQPTSLAHSITVTPSHGPDFQN